MKKWFRSILFLFVLNGYVVAGSAVLSNQCSNVKNSLEPFVLVLQEGESIQSALTQCSKDANIISGAVMGIGALKKTTLTHKSRKNHIVTYHNYMELNALNGVIGRDKENPDIHLHVIISDEDNHVLGGHLIDGVVGASAEITILPFNSQIQRRLNIRLGIKQIMIQ